MKSADWCFRWNIEATLLNGEKVDFVEKYGTISGLREVLYDHNITVSDATLYKMKNIQERTYGAVPLKPEQIAPAYQLITRSGSIVAEWHLKIGRLPLGKRRSIL